MKQCPHCNRLLDDTQLFCSDDGAELVSLAAEKNLSDEQLCPQCGNPTDLGARFCKHCAFQLIGSDTDDLAFTSKIDASRNSRSRMTLIVAGGLGLILISLLIAIVAFRNPQKTIANAENSQPEKPPVTLSEKGRDIEQRILRGDMLSTADLDGLPPNELRILRNVHFAKYGRKYDRLGLGDYFFNTFWYEPREDYKDSSLNGTDKANVELILKVEGGLKGGEPLASANSEPRPPEFETSAVQSNATRPAILDRDTVLPLLHAHMTRPVVAQMVDRSRPNTHEIYRQMVGDKVLLCTWSDTNKMYSGCSPGPEGKAFSVDHYFLDLHIGEIVPEAVTGITKPNESFAIAEVALTIRPNKNHELYTRYLGAFDKIYFKRTKKVSLRLFDDGWRFDQVLEF